MAKKKFPRPKIIRRPYFEFINYVVEFSLTVRTTYVHTCMYLILLHSSEYSGRLPTYDCISVLSRRQKKFL